jgi:hypothetical protein
VVHYRGAKWELRADFCPEQKIDYPTALSELYMWGRVSRSAQFNDLGPEFVRFATLCLALFCANRLSCRFMSLFCARIARRNSVGRTR